MPAPSAANGVPLGLGVQTCSVDPGDPEDLGGRWRAAALSLLQEEGGGGEWRCSGSMLQIVVSRDSNHSAHQAET